MAKKSFAIDGKLQQLYPSFGFLSVTHTYKVIYSEVTSEQNITVYL